MVFGNAAQLFLIKGTFFAPSIQMTDKHGVLALFHVTVIDERLGELSWLSKSRNLLFMGHDFRVAAEGSELCTFASRF